MGACRLLRAGKALLILDAADRAHENRGCYSQID